jgi:hypothetical protein
MGTGIQAYLEGGLDHRVHGGLAGIHPLHRNSLPGIDREPVLVGVEGEDQLALQQGPGGTDDAADRAVAVAERVGERARQGAEGLVERQVGIDLAPVGEQLGPARDPRPLRGHEDVSLLRRGEVDLPHLDPPWSHEMDRACLHQALPLAVTTVTGHPWSWWSG